MSSSPVPEIKDVYELNNGCEYSDKNLGPVINQGDLAQFIKEQKVEDGKFRISAINLFVYYPNLICNKVELKTFFDNLRPTNECIISHNHGNTYVFLNYGVKKGSVDKAKPFTSTLPHVFDFNTVRPNIFSFTRDGIAYSKSWIERADPTFIPKAKEDKSVFDRLKECKTKTEVLKKCYKSSDVSGNLQAWDVIQNEKEFTDEYIMAYKPWGWQLHMYQKIQYSGDDRKIYWYWNNIPMLGKSTIGYYLMVHFPKFFHVIGNPGYVKDTTTVLLNAMNGGWNGHTIIINLTMTYDGLDWLYGVLEAIKDPIFTTSKYNGKTMLKGMTNVVVFSNFEPYPYDKNGKMLIDPKRIDKVKIPLPEGLVDPNPPRIRKKTAELPDLNIRPEDQQVIDFCEQNTKLGDDVIIHTGGKIVIEKPSNSKCNPTDLEPKVENMPVCIPFPHIVKPVPDIPPPPLPDVSKIVKQFEKKPYKPFDPEARLWKIYLNKKEGSLNTKGGVVTKDQILLHSGVKIGERALVIARDTQYEVNGEKKTGKNYRLFDEGTIPSMKFYRDFFSKLKGEEKVFYEVITEGRPQKPFFDIDIPKKGSLTEFQSLELVKYIQAGILKADKKIKIENIMTFSSHGSEKWSYHIIVDKFFVLNNWANKDFFEEVKSYVPTHLQNPMDESVYKGVQQLRMYGCQKIGSGRWKILASQNTWINEEKEDRLKELRILQASLVAENTGCQILTRKVNEKPQYDGPVRGYNSEEIKKVKEVVEAKFPKIFEFGGENKNSLLFLRSNPSLCLIHNRIHEHQNVSVYIKSSSNKIWYRCFNVIDSDPIKEYEIGSL